MRIHKLQHTISKLEKEYGVLKKELKKHPLVLTTGNSYLKEDKRSFLKLWEKYIQLLNEIQQVVAAARYRKYFFIVNYNKMILRKYTLVMYFNIIMETESIFGKHDSFIRTLLKDHFKNDFGHYAKYIYHPRYVNLINTPNVFLRPFKHRIKRNIYALLEPGVIQTHNNLRLEADYNNLFFYIRYRYDKVMYAFMKKIGFVISHTRFSSRKNGFITQKNLKSYLQVAKPGDILLTRGNWNATNIGIPGFWKHMSMYIGTGKYLKKHFSKKHTKKLEDDLHYLIESTGQGVNIVEMNHIAEINDYLGVARTCFSKEKIKRTIKNSFSYIGSKYDFIFDFYSDKNLVCSELIMKSYARETVGDEGIDIDLEHVGSGLVFPPNNFIALLKREKRFKKPSVEPFFFIDSQEKLARNFIADKNDLFSSGTRARLSIFLQ